MSFTRATCGQGSSEWHALRDRLDIVPASKLSTINDLDPYQTRLQYFEEKVLKIKPDNKGKEWLFEKGHEAEEQGRKYANANLGFNFVPSVLLSGLVPGMLCSADGIDESRGVIFEHKMSSLDALDKAQKGEIPIHHQYQNQGALFVSGYDRLVYMVTHKTEFVVVDVKPDKELHKKFADDVPAFIELCKSGEYPEPSERDYFEPNDARFEELILLKKIMDDAEKNFERLKTELVKDFSLYSRIRYRDLLMIKSTRKGSINYGKIAELKSIDLEKYRGAPVTSVSVKFGKAKNE